MTPHDQSPDGLLSTDTALKAAVERVSRWMGNGMPDTSDHTAHSDRLKDDLRTLLAALSERDAEIERAVEMVSRRLMAERDEANANGAAHWSRALAAEAALSSQADRAELLVDALVQADLTIRSQPGADQSHVEFIRTALSKYRTLTGVSHD